MSFLQHLRQEQASTDGDMALCYILSIAPETGQTRLKLAVSQFRYGTPAGKRQAYTLQRQHLQSPPAFVAPNDVECLANLLENSPLWLQHAQGHFPTRNTQAFLKAILETGRTFLEDGSGFWRSLALGEPLPLKVHWRIFVSGEQRLCWKASPGQQLLFLGGTPEFSVPLLYDVALATVALGVSPYGVEASRCATNGTYCLGSTEVCDFLQEPPPSWKEWGFPLPQALPAVDVSAIRRPILSCRNPFRPEKEAFLELTFEYETEKFCTYQKYADQQYKRTSLEYWDGAVLSRLVREPKQEAEFYRALSQALQLLGFSPAPEFAANKPMIWVADNTACWQKLFESRQEFSREYNMAMVVEKDFQHHYVIPEGLHIALETLGNSSIKLDANLKIEQQNLNIQDLVLRLRDLNQQILQDRGENGTADFSIPLPDGRLLVLPDNYLAIFSQLSDLVRNSKNDLELPLQQAYRLGQIDAELPGSITWQGDTSTLENARELLQTPALLNAAQFPIQATLRTYQWLGVCWLQHLKQLCVNGLLADDMGLGKTLQTLAHLALEHQQNPQAAPALVVVPTSLLHNWAAEIKRFTPQLKSIVFHGAKRHAYWQTLSQYNIVITSYQLIVNDLPQWMEQHFSWLVLDEAQTIKNIRTKSSQAVRQIDTDHRLCLTGTPVENHLGELWCILDFLMPGFLGEFSQFKAHFQKPIEQGGNQHRFQALMDRVAPVMLRRTKNQIAKDLPKKTEIVQYIDMSEDQHIFYQDLLERNWSSLEEENAQQPGQQQILILTLLLKLRQACCDPALLGEPGINSAKREHCIEMIKALVAEKSCILVFSQFTAMLDLLAKDLSSEGIEFAMLTGRTAKRQEVIRSFQDGKAPVFLISLKAGGVGLNLTRADTVIHYDPWWNNAAQQQATDRAHRIGQTRPVFEYKLITKDTVEEKIALLQNRKSVLGENVNKNAQFHAEQFSLKLEDMLELVQNEKMDIPQACR